MCNKLKWKASIIYNDAIHVQAEGGGKDNNVEGIGTSKANDYLCVVHDVW
jgi:predicted transposase YbfD/YdcC